MAANRCTECHRLLKDPYSILLGIGPECRGRRIKSGWKFPKPKWKVDGGRTVLVGVVGKIEPPKEKEKKVKHGRNQSKSSNATR